MISTNDLVEPYEMYNIHPRNKTKVGQRLSYLALNLTYGLKQIHCFGPQYKSWTAKGSEAWVSFDHLEMGICRNYDLRGFEVAGEDRVFHFSFTNLRAPQNKASIVCRLLLLKKKKELKPNKKAL